MQRHRHLKQLGLMHAGKVQTPQIACQRIAHGQCDDNRATAHPHQRDAVEDHDDRQHHAREHEVFAIGKSAIAHRGKAAAHADQADLDQRQADH